MWTGKLSKVVAVMRGGPPRTEEFAPQVEGPVIRRLAALASVLFCMWNEPVIVELDRRVSPPPVRLRFSAASSDMVHPPQPADWSQRTVYSAIAAPIPVPSRQRQAKDRPAPLGAPINDLFVLMAHHVDGLGATMVFGGVVEERAFPPRERDR